MVKKMGGFISTNNPVENQQVGVSAYILFCNKYAVRRFIDKTYENFQYDKSAHGPMCAYTKFYSTDKYNNMHFQKMMLMHRRRFHPFCGNCGQLTHGSPDDIDSFSDELLSKIESMEAK